MTISSSILAICWDHVRRPSREVKERYSDEKILWSSTRVNAIRSNPTLFSSILSQTGTMPKFCSTPAQALLIPSRRITFPINFCKVSTYNVSLSSITEKEYIQLHFFNAKSQVYSCHNMEYQVMEIWSSYQYTVYVSKPYTNFPATWSTIMLDVRLSMFFYQWKFQDE